MAAVLFKVALLTLKTAAKPLAKQFEKLVMSHPVMRKQVIGLAQASRHQSRVAWQPTAAAFIKRQLPAEASSSSVE